MARTILASEFRLAASASLAALSLGLATTSALAQDLQKGVCGDPSDVDGDGRAEYVLGRRDGELYVYQFQTPARWRR